MITGFTWAWTVFWALGPEQEKDKKARENPKITPIKTRLKTNRFFEESFCKKFMYRSC
jgi:hypothetical protein